jgi:hypothetical protein
LTPVFSSSQGYGGAAVDENLSRFCCQNEQCPDHGKREAGNLTVCGRYGKQEQHRLLYCRTCRARFSERKGTPLFRSKLPQDKAVSIFDRNTVVHYSRLAGPHAQQIHDEFVAFSPSNPRNPVRREVVVRLQETGAL